MREGSLFDISLLDILILVSGVDLSTRQQRVISKISIPSITTILSIQAQSDTSAIIRLLDQLVQTYNRDLYFG